MSSFLLLPPLSLLVLPLSSLPLFRRVLPSGPVLRRLRIPLGVPPCQGEAESRGNRGGDNDSPLFSSAFMTSNLQSTLQESNPPRPTFNPACAHARVRLRGVKEETGTAARQEAASLPRWATRAFCSAPLDRLKRTRPQDLWSSGWRHRGRWAADGAGRHGGHGPVGGTAPVES